MAPSSMERELMTECVAIIHKLNGDELEVVAGILRGMRHGQRKYGPMNVREDSRDWLVEGAEEARDLAVYIGAWLLKASRG